MGLLWGVLQNIWIIKTKKIKSFCFCVFTNGNLGKEYAVKRNFVKIVWRLFSSVNVLSAFAQPLC